MSAAMKSFTTPRTLRSTSKRSFQNPSTESSTSSSDLQLPFPHEPHPLQSQFRHLCLFVSRGNNIDNDPPVLVAALNRPTKRNALHRELWVEWGRLASLVGNGTDDASRAVLWCASGPAFCSGIDVSDHRLLPRPAEDVAHAGWVASEHVLELQRCISAWESICRVPVVAAVHGACIGAGVDWVSAADVVWCTSDATFSVREVALGLAADVGTLQRLPKRTGNHSLVREVCYTGRYFSASEALQMGLVGRTFPTRDELLHEAYQLCRTIAAHSPVAVQGTRESLLYARDHSVPDGLLQIARYNSLALQSRDLAIAWKASRNKNQTSQRPRFYDLPPRPKL